jgi:acyl-CoA thioester hydrolase
MLNDDAGRNENAGDAIHVWPIRVYYEDTDAAGLVYYANYLKFVERARTELLRDIGIDHTRMLAEDGLAFAVRDCAIEYRSPARLDDALEVRTRLLDITGAALRAEQTVFRDDEMLARATLRIVCLRTDGRPSRLPKRIRDALAPYHIA